LNEKINGIQMSPVEKSADSHTTLSPSRALFDLLALKMKEQISMPGSLLLPGTLIIFHLRRWYAWFFQQIAPQGFETLIPLGFNDLNPGRDAL
jgi:hypothetical protein